MKLEGVAKGDEMRIAFCVVGGHRLAPVRVVEVTDTEIVTRDDHENGSCRRWSREGVPVSEDDEPFTLVSIEEGEELLQSEEDARRMWADLATIAYRPGEDQTIDADDG